MLKIEVKPGEKIEQALKRYKRKVRNTQLLSELKRRKHYTKPSAARREKKLKAEYRLQYLLENEEG